jgi:hypothetical protein
MRGSVQLLSLSKNFTTYPGERCVYHIPGGQFYSETRANELTERDMTEPSDGTGIRSDFGPGRVASKVYWIGSSIAFAIVYAVTKRPPPGTSWWVDIGIATFATLLVGAVTAGLGGYLSRRHKRWHQSQRDARAADVIHAVTAGRWVNFSLYLRAFETTGELLQAPLLSITSPGFDPRPAHDQYSDFEAALAEALEESAPLLALGGRGAKGIGPGRVEASDSTWRQMLEVLGKSATLIFVVPSERPTVQWEISWLVDRKYLAKTIFILPPRRSRWLPSRSKPMPWEDKWETFVANMRARGLEFPSYDKGGVLFMLSNDGKHFSTSHMKGVQEAIRLKSCISTLSLAIR